MVTFTLTPSGRLKWLLIVVHFLALCACFGNALPIAAQSVLAIALAAHCWWLAKRPLTWQTVGYSAASGWEMTRSDGVVAVRILPGTVVTAFALFLHVEIQANHAHIISSSVFYRLKPKNRPTLLLLPDSLKHDSYRNLVVKLKTSYKINGKSANLLVESV